MHSPPPPVLYCPGWQPIQNASPVDGWCVPASHARHACCARPACGRGARPGGEGELIGRYQDLLQEIPKLDLQRDLVELPPCTIQTIQHSLFKPFMFQECLNIVVDWLRLYLVSRYGGVWLDASIVLRVPLDGLVQHRARDFVGFYMAGWNARPDARVVESWFLAAPPRALASPGAMQKEMRWGRRRPISRCRSNRAANADRDEGVDRRLQFRSQQLGRG